MAPFILPIQSNLSKSDYEREINTLMLFSYRYKMNLASCKTVVTVKT